MSHPQKDRLHHNFTIIHLEREALSIQPLNHDVRKSWPNPSMHSKSFTSGTIYKNMNIMKRYSNYRSPIQNKVESSPRFPPSFLCMTICHVTHLRWQKRKAAVDLHKQLFLISVMLITRETHHWGPCSSWLERLDAKGFSADKIGR